MKKVFAILLITISLSYNNFSQTIDYTYASVGNSCNVFAKAKTYANYVHQTSFGFPYYSPIDKALVLQSQPISSSSQGSTQYAISYPFKQGFTYKIAIYGKSSQGSPNSYLPSAALSFSNNNGGTNGDSTSCTGPQSVSSSFDVNYGHMAFTTGWSWSPNLIDGVASQNFSYLLVAAFPQPGSYTNDNSVSLTFIRKIQIVEIPPTSSFTLSPATTPITCGSTTPITYTINNVNNLSGISSYTWNLGSANNGWEYNGSNAPQSIVTTSNTLTLTPLCGSVQSSIIATVTANATNYNTNSSIINISQPTMKINGLNTLCSGSSDYSMTGLACNSDITWAIAPSSGIVSLSSGSGPSTTLTRTSDGNTTLTATVNSCGLSQNFTQSVHAGAYASSDYSLLGNNGSSYWCPNQTVTYNVSGPAGSNYSWNVPSGWSITYNGGNYISVRTPSSPYPPTGSVSVSFTEPCGNSITLNSSVYYSSSACSTGNFPYTLSPNPASSTLTISCTSLQTYCNIAAVQITDVYGTVLSNQSWPYTNQQVQVSVSFLQNGTYVVKVYDGSVWYSKQFMVSH